MESNTSLDLSTNRTASVVDRTPSWYEIRWCDMKKGTRVPIYYSHKVSVWKVKFFLQTFVPCFFSWYLDFLTPTHTPSHSVLCKVGILLFLLFINSSYFLRVCEWYCVDGFDSTTSRLVFKFYDSSRQTTVIPGVVSVYTFHLLSLCFSSPVNL